VFAFLKRIGGGEGKGEPRFIRIFPHPQADHTPERSVAFGIVLQLGQSPA